MKVKSPYNFVPAPIESEIFLPDWADQVSHDIPFSDGKSGEIELVIKAVTPVFIRNGHAKDVEENEFSHFINDMQQKQYFIPATSIKGMIRNVLEIMTFSRMSQIKGDDLFGIRDMNNYEYKIEMRGVKSGWLEYDAVTNSHIIFPCDNHRINLIDLEVLLGLPPGSFMGKTAVEKNTLLSTKPALNNFNFVSQVNMIGDVYKFDAAGTFNGEIVMFGDIKNKRFDYIFGSTKEPPIPIDPLLMKKFEVVESGNTNSLWKYFKGRGKTSIPVFYKEQLVNKKTIIKHFGFSKLYKLSDSYFLNELEPLKSYKSSANAVKLDFAELLFGQTRIKDNALKGRLYISHAMCTSGSPEENIQTRVLNSPKASFYPAYLKQNGTGGILNTNVSYNTYRSESGILKGYKRYPVHNLIKPNISAANENIESKFIPLKAGATFSCKIRYHNLREVEFGALLSAITFHNNVKLYHHSIGGVKPYGFGKIHVEVKDLDMHLFSMQKFEEKMGNHLNGPNKWINSTAIQQLFSIASNPKNKDTDDLLCYPTLGPPNEFNLYKKDKIYLENYSERNLLPTIPSLINEDFKKVLQLKKEEKIKIVNDLVCKGDSALSKSEFANAIKYFTSAASLDNLLLIEDKILLAKKGLIQIEYEHALTSGNLKSFIEKFPNSEFTPDAKHQLSVIKARMGIDKDWLSLVDFNNLANRIPSWRKKQVNGEIPAEFVEDLKALILNIIQLELKDNKTRKNWKGDFATNRNFSKIIDWLGYFTAKSIYDTIN